MAKPMTGNPLSSHVRAVRLSVARPALSFGLTFTHPVGYIRRIHPPSVPTDRHSKNRQSIWCPIKRRSESYDNGYNTDCIVIDAFL